MILHIPKKDVPQRIIQFVISVLNKSINEYKIDNTGLYHAHMPWHEADRTYTQMFELSPPMTNVTVYGSTTVVMARPTDFHFSRSGLEGDGCVTGKELEGSVEIPTGFVFVEVGIYPQRCTIFTAKDATVFLPIPNVELHDLELVILFQARSVKTFARTRWPDIQYKNLIEKGLLKRNRSITMDGKNILNANINRLQEINKLNKYPYMSNVSIQG